MLLLGRKECLSSFHKWSVQQQICAKCDHSCFPLQLYTSGVSEDEHSENKAHVCHLHILRQILAIISPLHPVMFIGRDQSERKTTIVMMAVV